MATAEGATDLPACMLDSTSVRSCITLVSFISRRCRTAAGAEFDVDDDWATLDCATSDDDVTPVAAVGRGISTDSQSTSIDTSSWKALPDEVNYTDKPSHIARVYTAVDGGRGSSMVWTDISTPYSSKYVRFIGLRYNICSYNTGAIPNQKDVLTTSVNSRRPSVGTRLMTPLVGNDFSAITSLVFLS